MRIRLALAACIVIACGLFGKSLASAARRRVHLLAEIQRALKTLEIGIGDELLPLDDALRETEFLPFLHAADRLESQTPADAWREIQERWTRRSGSGDCLKDREKRALAELFEHLGESGCAFQKERICRCRRRLQSAEAEAQDNVEKNGKLWVSVGLLTGMALAVLFL